MPVEKDIEDALFEWAAGMTLTGDPPIAWSNNPFPASGDTPTTYVAIKNQANRNTRLFLKGTDPHWRQGILQINIVTPLGVGPSDLTTLVGEVAEHFPADLVLYKNAVKVRIQLAPHPFPAEKSDDDVSWVTHVDVPYEVYI